MAPMRSLARACVCVLALVLSSTASAQEADRLVDEGIALREERRDTEALERFQQAYAIEAAPRTLVQIALAEQALGRFSDAEAHLVQALAIDDRFISRHRELLEGALAEIRGELGSVHIGGEPEGASVLIGGREVGTTPLSTRVMPGEVEVEVRAAGFAPRRSRIEVARGEVAELEVTLEPAPPSLSAVPAPDTSPPAEISVLTIAGAAIAAAGVIGVAIGAGLLAVREEQAQARLQCSDTDPACRDRFYAALDAEGAGIALFVAGSALALAGGALIVFGALGGAQAEGRVLACTPGLLALTCTASF
jgi:tetratricopeptide (TPR) repeat protein